MRGKGKQLHLRNLKLALRLGRLQPKTPQLRLRRCNVDVAVVHSSPQLVGTRLNVTDFRAQRQQPSLAHSYLAHTGLSSCHRLQALKARAGLRPTQLLLGVFKLPTPTRLRTDGLAASLAGGSTPATAAGAPPREALLAIWHLKHNKLSRKLPTYTHTHIGECQTKAALLEVHARLRRLRLRTLATIGFATIGLILGAGSAAAPLAGATALPAAAADCLR